MPAQAYLPPMGRRWLLPLYDPFSRLAGLTRVHEELLDRVDPQAGHSVLEIGCGTGNLLLALARRGVDAQITGIDPDRDALTRARRKARKAGASIHWRLAYAGALPFADGSVDRVLSSFMLHHLENDELRRAANEVRRVLAPGGELHVVDVSGPTGGHGLGAHLISRNARLSGSTGGRVLTALNEAGLTAATETGEGALWLGAYTFYRAGSGSR